jgi:hypothetical protein
LWSLFSSGSHGVYPITLITVAALGYAFSQRRLFDVFVISAIGLSANVLLVSGLARALLHDTRGAEIPLMLLIGCAAAGLLAATVKLILHLSRRYA